MHIFFNNREVHSLYELDLSGQTSKTNKKKREIKIKKRRIPKTTNKVFNEENKILFKKVNKIVGCLHNEKDILICIHMVFRYSPK